MDDNSFPGLHSHQLTPDISWRFYKHWGQGYLAGEGIEWHHGDRSGCLRMVDGMKMVNAPIVAQARLYESAKGSLSAVYSYPNGLGFRPSYFWEIYDSELLSDPERYNTEAEMEQRVIEVLSDAAKGDSSALLRRRCSNEVHR